jgi:hypothetical protein
MTLRAAIAIPEFSMLEMPAIDLERTRSGSSGAIAARN